MVLMQTPSSRARLQKLSKGSPHSMEDEKRCSRRWALETAKLGAHLVEVEPVVRTKAGVGGHDR